MKTLKINAKLFEMLNSYAKGEGCSVEELLTRFVKSHRIKPQTDETFDHLTNNLQLFINSANDEMWSVDSEYRLVICNLLFKQRVTEMLGHEPDIGERLLTLTIPEYNDQAWQGYYDRALRGDSFSVDVYTQTEPKRAIEYQFTPVRAKNGLINGVTVIGRDITKRKQAEISALQNELRFKLSMQLAKLGIWDWEIASDKTEWYGEMFNIYGITPEEFTGKGNDYIEFTRADYRDQQKANIVNAFENGLTEEELLAGKDFGSSPKELCIVAPNGTERYTLGDAIHMVDQNGKPIRMLGVTLDITDIKKAELEIKHRDAILEAVNTTATRLLRAADWNEEVEPMLRLLGQACNVDRAGMLELTYINDYVYRGKLRDEWDAPGISSAMPNSRLQDFDLRGEGFGDVLGRLLQGLTTVLDRTQNPSLQFLQSDTITLLLVPIWVHKKLWGLLYFSTVKAAYHWAKSEIDALHIAADTFGAAIERWFAEESIRKHSLRLEVLHQIDEAILAAVSADEIAQATLVYIEQLIKCQQIAIVVYTDNGRNPSHFANNNTFKGMKCEEVLDKQGLDLLRQGQITIYQDLSTMIDPSPSAKRLLDAQFASLAAIPLYIQGHLIGTLYLADKKRNFFTSENIEIAGEIADLLAIAIQETRLRKDEAHRRQIAETLVKATTVLNSTLELNHVLDLILVQLRQVIAYDRVSIQQLNGDTLKVIACQGFDTANSLIGFQITPIPQSILQNVFAMKQPMAIADVTASDTSIRSIDPALKVGSWLGLPLLSKEVVIGMIALKRNEVRPFSEEDIQLTTAFASHAAMAIENAQLYEQIQQHAAELEVRVKERTGQLEQANEELQVLSRMKDEFVSNVSHELRTPITSLNLHHYILTKMPDSLAERLPTLIRETNRLGRIIDDLLTLSRLDQERTPFLLDASDLNVAVRQFVIDRESLAADRGLTLEINCINSPLIVQADIGLLEQVLSVLMTNAVNYTPSGGKIVVNTDKVMFDNQWWANFSITDNGPGIPKDEQANLFTRFFRGKTGQKSGVAGTGLGLAIAKEIVDRHQGRIMVASEGIPGQGTTFTVSIPIVEAKQQ